MEVYSLIFTLNDKFICHQTFDSKKRKIEQGDTLLEMHAEPWHCEVACSLMMHCRALHTRFQA